VRGGTAARSGKRWVYLDVGMLGGIIETPGPQQRS
jgi:hypothetical protein